MKIFKQKAVCLTLAISMLAFSTSTYPIGGLETIRGAGNAAITGIIRFSKAIYENTRDGLSEAGGFAKKQTVKGASKLYEKTSYGLSKTRDLAKKIAVAIHLNQLANGISSKAQAASSRVKNNRVVTSISTFFSTKFNSFATRLQQLKLRFTRWRQWNKFLRTPDGKAYETAKKTFRASNPNAATEEFIKTAEGQAHKNNWTRFLGRHLPKTYKQFENRPHAAPRVVKEKKEEANKAEEEAEKIVVEEKPVVEVKVKEKPEEAKGEAALRQAQDDRKEEAKAEEEAEKIVVEEKPEVDERPSMHKFVPPANRKTRPKVAPKVQPNGKKELLVKKEEEEKEKKVLPKKKQSNSQGKAAIVDKIEVQQADKVKLKIEKK